MDGYRAVFIAEDGATATALHSQALAATSIQGAIDEAQACAARFAAARRIDIFKGDDKVQSVGTGEAPYRT